MAGRTQTSGATRRLSAIRCHGEVGRWRRGIACGLDHVCGRSGARSGDHTHAARQRNVGPHVNFPSNRGGFFNEMWPDITCSWLTVATALVPVTDRYWCCLLYTSDAADDLLCV